METQGTGAQSGLIYHFYKCCGEQNAQGSRQVRIKPF